MDLKQHRNWPIDLLSLLVNFDQEFEGIHPMYEVNKWRDVFDLVALQMPNHVPTGIRRHLGLLGLNFLDFILPKIANSCGIGSLKVSQRFGFADCYQFAIWVLK